MAAGVGAVGGRGTGRGAVHTSEFVPTHARVHGCMCTAVCAHTARHACLRAGAQTRVRARGGVCKHTCAHSAHLGVRIRLPGLTTPRMRVHLQTCLPCTPMCAHMRTDVPALHSCMHTHRRARQARPRVHTRVQVALGAQWPMGSGTAGPAKPPAPRRYLLGHGVDEADVEVLLSPEPCGERGGGQPCPHPRQPPCPGTHRCCTAAGAGSGSHCWFSRRSAPGGRRLDGGGHHGPPSVQPSGSPGRAQGCGAALVTPHMCDEFERGLSLCSAGSCTPPRAGGLPGGVTHIPTTTPSPPKPQRRGVSPAPSPRSR